MLFSRTEANPPAIRLGMSLEPMGSTATRCAHVRYARQIGFDLVHAIEHRGDHGWNAATHHSADGQLSTAQAAVRASYELPKQAGQLRGLVAIGALTGTAEEVKVTSTSGRSTVSRICSCPTEPCRPRRPPALSW